MRENYKGRKGKKAHYKTLQIALEASKLQGNRVIDLQEKSPDAIEIYVKDGKIIVNCIEVMSGKTKKAGWRMNQHVRNKETLYKNLGFDDVIIYQYEIEEEKS